MKQPYRPGAAVAVRTDERPWPHLGLIKDVYNNEKGALLCDVLWLYRYPDLKKQPADTSLFCPCTLEVTDSHGNVNVMHDPGDLKEVFFSAHEDTILHSTIMHEVRVLFLPNCGSNLSPTDLIKIKLQPGFICRQLVDIQDWSLYPLKPSLLWSDNAQLLKPLLKASEQELKAMLAS